MFIDDFFIQSALKLFISCILGGIIGFERERNNRPAGFRTHILVSISSCLAMIINYKVYEEFGGAVDPGRMGSYVISGIGFLGAGTIIKGGATVKGLTTAATLWGCGMIGLACGAGLYKLSIFVVLMFIFTLLIVGKIEFYLHNKNSKKNNNK